MSRRFTVLFVILLAGCVDVDQPSVGVERSDSGRTEIVTHTVLIPSGVLEVEPQPEVWIEGDERISPLGRIVSLAVLGDGSIVAADADANQIHAFTSGGAYLWSAGRAGEGPGEFQQISALFVTHQDTILVADLGLDRLTFLSPAGVLAGDKTFASEVGAPVGLLSSGALLYRRQERIGEPSVGVQHSRATWSAVDREGVSVRTLTTTSGTASYYGLAGGRNVIVRPAFIRHAFAAPANGGFVVSVSDQPRVDHYGPEGDLLRSIRLPEDAISEDIANPQAVREGLLGSMPEDMRAVLAEMVAGIPIPPRWPPIGGLMVDDVGRLWVQEYRPAGSSATTWCAFR